MATITHVRSTAITTNTTQYTVTNVNPTVGRLVVVMTGASATVVNAVVTDNKGGTYTLVSSGTWSSTAHCRNIFIGAQLATTSSMSIIVGYTGDAATGLGISVFDVAGLSTTRLGSNALRQSANLNNQTSATAPTFTFPTAVSSNNPTLGFFTNLTSALAITPPTGWTEGTADFGNTTPSLGFECIFRNDTFNGTTGNWGTTSASAWGMTMIELDTSVLTAAAGIPSRTLRGVGR